MDNNLPDQIVSKSYRVGYALFRVAAKLREGSSKRHLEDKGLDIIVAALEGGQEQLEKDLRTAEYVLAFLRDIGILHGHTANLIFKEIEDLRSSFAALPDPAIAMTVAELFPEEASTTASPLIRSSGSSDHAFKPDQPAIASRREAILNRIRQSGNCRLKDVQEALRGVSERTLRYDLQRLIEEGAVERQGNGGPATFYRMRV